MLSVNFDEYKELEPQSITINRHQLSVNTRLKIYRETDGELFFETREPKSLPRHAADEIKVLNMETLWGRFDLLSARYYGTVRLWWIFLDVNIISDPFDIPKGEAVRVPARTNVYGRAVNV